jgi:YHS domain-containing protein|tara:strand:- start:196 stop:621 length:426 start_codon:yes stop_codon:yes gene_type:complete
MKSIQHSFIILSSLMCIVQLAANSSADEMKEIVGTVWQLERNGSSGISHGDGQVVYFLSSDAYHTYKSRKFQTWDSFSMVDARNLVRLKKKDKIEIVESRLSGVILQVKLLDGFYKGKTYYLISEELKKNFKKEMNENGAV